MNQHKLIQEMQTKFHSQELNLSESMKNQHKFNQEILAKFLSKESDLKEFKSKLSFLETSINSEIILQIKTLTAMHEEEKLEKNKQIAHLSRRLDSSLEKQYTDLSNNFKQEIKININESNQKQNNILNRIQAKLTTQETNLNNTNQNILIKNNQMQSTDNSIKTNQINHNLENLQFYKI